MKTIKIFTMITIFSMFMLNNSELKAQTKEKKITATYTGMNITDNFKFEDSKGNLIVFHDEDQSFKSNLTLLDEGLIGKKLVIYYKWVEVILSDSEGKMKTMKVKRITNYHYRNSAYKNNSGLASLN